MPYVPRRPARHEDHLVRGLSHRVALWGPPSDDPIVLLHGYMDCAETYQFLVDALPDDWSFVAPDWRGHGGTAWAPGGYWFPDYLADLEQLLTRYVPNRPARVVGHSMGGNIAAMYAGVRPKRLEWLINLEGFGLPRVAPDQAPLRYAKWLDQLHEPLRRSRDDTPAKLVRRLRERNPRISEDHAEFITQAWMRPRGDTFDLAADPRHRWRNPVLYRREETEACWARIEAPMLLVLGELSEFLPGLGEDGRSDEFHRHIRDLEVDTLAGVGHMMHHEDPVAVARAVRAFVERRTRA